MKTFIVRSEMTCCVTRQYLIDAEDECAALEKFLEGDHDKPIIEKIGDSIDEEVIEVEDMEDERQRLYEKYGDERLRG